MSLKVQITHDGPNVALVLEGNLDEICQLPQFAEPINGRLTIDLEKLVTINSLGCRKWVLWIKEKARAKGGVSMIHCSPAVVNQINVLSGFVPETVDVDSFFVPYVCDHCGHEERVLLTRGEEYGTDHLSVADEIPCPKCHAVMSMDVLRERYFRFVAKKRSA